MVEVVLFNPEIPQNTGNIGRTCVAVGAELTLVRPLGFSLASKFLKRAGMDYWQHLRLNIVDDLEEYLFSKYSLDQLVFLTTKSDKPYYRVDLSSERLCLIFGSEGGGLPAAILEKYQKKSCTIPMNSEARSLNLASSVGIVLYESIRQRDALGSMLAN